MRPNGLHLALVTLLVPAAAFAQTATGGEAVPAATTETSAAPAIPEGGASTGLVPAAADEPPASEAATPAPSGTDTTAPPGGTIPGGTIPGGTIPGSTVPGGTVPGGNTPGGTVPGGTVPGGTVPGGTVPGGNTPGGTVPGDTIPGDTIPGGTTPGGTVPGGTIPGDTTPGDTTVTDTAVTDTGADDAAPSGAVTGTADAGAGNGAAPDAGGEAGAAAPEEVDETERAFAEIYGGAADGESAVPGATTLPTTYDPWERYNRKMHRFNNAVDRTVARPLARGYVKVVPRPVRRGVSNFFNNLSQPVTMVNSLLQGKPKQAGQALGRFLLNTTFGIGGVFDPASRANLPQKGEDFGQTLGVWGWRRSRYVELPLFGPRTVRDVFGMGGDAPLSPLRRVEADRVRVPVQGLQLVDIRAQLLPTDSLREGAEDDYALVRDAWSQRREYQIFGDRMRNGEDLPDYLRDEDSDPTVPVDAMPVNVPEG